MNLAQLIPLLLLPGLYQPLHRTAWPTSSFSENRGVRYHAGVDYGTESQEGWPVYTPESGTVEEIRFGPFYYGKVVYFRGRSGRIWLWAHLSGYAPRLDSLVMAKRFRSKLNQGSLKWKRGAGPAFDSGSVIAYSGSTGIGEPHLHLELRDSTSSRVVSPCANGMECPDTIPPFLLGAAAWDTSDVATLRLTSAEALAQGCIESSAPPNAFAFKYADYSRKPLDNPMSIRTLQLQCGDKPVFLRDYTSQTYGNMSRIRQELLWSEEADTAGDWHFPGKGEKPNGNILIARDLQPCVQGMTVTATDYSGNRSTQQLHLSRKCPGTPPPTHRRQSGPVFTFLARTWIQSSACDNGGNVMLQDSLGHTIRDLCSENDGRDFELGAYLLRNSNARMLTIHSKEGIHKYGVGLVRTHVPVVAEIPGAEIRFTASPMGGATAWAVGWWRGASVPPFTEGVAGNALEMHPKGLNLDGLLSACVEARQSEDLHYLGETSRKWILFSRQVRDSSRTCITMDELRDLRLARDTQAPRIGVAQAATVRLGDSVVPVVRIPLIENGDGIPDGNSVQTWQDNTWIPNEYDAETHLLQVEQRHLIGKGPLRVNAEDEAGNRASATVALP